jgi:radical SAM superfamily enzyme YgiQ (UPF0313 family)
MSKILLVQAYAYSSFRAMPMGLIHVASELAVEHDVVVRDLCATPMNDSEFTALLEKENPGYVMIGGTSPSVPESFELARLAKEFNNGIITVKGGPHEDNGGSEDTLIDENIDIVVSGDGEAVAGLVRTIENGNYYPENFRGDFDLSLLQLPNRMLLYPQNPGYYDFMGGRTAQTRTDRGCKFKCGFCVQGKLREYSDEYVVRDLEQISTEGFESLYFDNALFTLNRERIMRLLPEVARFNFNDIGCITGAGINTDVELLTAMAEVGFSYISMALESASTTMLEFIGKNWVELKIVKEAIGNAKGAGMRTSVNVMFGNPYELDEDVYATIDAILDIKPDAISPSIFTLYPGNRINPIDPNIYDKPINRNDAFKHFDEGYGGKVLISADRVEWIYEQLQERVVSQGIGLITET